MSSNHMIAPNPYVSSVTTTDQRERAGGALFMSPKACFLQPSQAALYRQEKSTFLDAAAALHRGLGTLDPVRKWSDFFDEAFEMTDALARMELIVGNYDACTDMTNEVLMRAKTLKMRINALMIEVECVMAQNDVEASIAAGCQSRTGFVGCYHTTEGILSTNRFKAFESEVAVGSQV